MIKLTKKTTEREAPRCTEREYESRIFVIGRHKYRVSVRSVDCGKGKRMWLATLELQIKVPIRASRRRRGVRRISRSHLTVMVNSRSVYGSGRSVRGWAKDRHTAIAKLKKSIERELMQVTRVAIWAEKHL